MWYVCQDATRKVLKLAPVLELSIFRPSLTYRVTHCICLIRLQAGSKLLMKSCSIILRYCPRLMPLYCSAASSQPREILCDLYSISTPWWVWSMRPVHVLSAYHQQALAWQISPVFANILHSTKQLGITPDFTASTWNKEEGIQKHSSWREGREDWKSCHCRDQGRDTGKNGIWLRVVSS